MLSVRRLADPCHRIAHLAPPRLAVRIVRIAAGDHLRPLGFALSPAPERIEAA